MGMRVIPYLDDRIITSKDPDRLAEFAWTVRSDLYKCGIVVSEEKAAGHQHLSCNGWVLLLTWINLH